MPKNALRRNNVKLGDTGIFNRNELGEKVITPRPLEDVKIETRPTGTDPSQNIDVTRMTASQEAEAIRQQKARIFAQQIPPIEELQKQEALPKEPVGVYPEGSIPNKIASAFGRDVPQKTLTQTGKEVLRTAATIYDSLSSILLSRDTLPVRQATASFNDASNLINQDIIAVQTGQMSATEALKDVQTAVASINRLEAQTKGLGLVNLKYWLDDGQSLEIQIALEKQILENQRLKLQVAAGLR